LTLLDDAAAVIPFDPHAPATSGGWVIRDADAVAQVAVHLAVLAAASKPLSTTGRVPIELAPREVDVVQLLSAGLTDEAIGRRLKIADRTVRRIVAHLLAKLGVDSRFELAVECARRNLV
jgi:DNA-binding NarL/FixJ family response regulator